ncbi:MAG TPA: membrane-bound O-acyltransferase family protein [Desulfobulbaceae bacterium]|nr:membrane-bound O-acyltransferase family protein [Desulfobulbaceae bacterium]
MVYSSFTFLFLFLPVTLAGFFLLGRRDEHWAASWLLLASLAFYVSWNPAYLPILAISILGNYLAYRAILRAPEARKTIWLILAVAGNLLLLGYFKYGNFFIQTVNDLGGAAIHPLDVLLPIGISFFSFTQIAFLFDARHGKAQDVSLWRYALFASYFPYIVAGPVLNHKDMLPQFANRRNYTVTANNLAVGLTLFAFGLAKKVLIADNLVPVVDAAFAGENPQLLAAWVGMLAYSFQLYFDFSGYSDMAIGVSRMLGFQIPFNFDSPYKSANVSEFWTRWHISLSRFLRNYLYIPLGGNRHGQFKRYRNLMLTMLLGGLWHGSNWTFVIWGGLHGLYLCIQHGWQAIRGKAPGTPRRGVVAVNRILTFVAVLVAWTFFRAPDIHSAMDVLMGLAGLNGLAAAAELGPWELSMVGVSAFIAFLMPNTNQIFLYFENRFPDAQAAFSLLRLQWRPSLRWALVTGVILVIGILNMERTADFIYAQF